MENNTNDHHNRKGHDTSGTIPLVPCSTVNPLTGGLMFGTHFPDITENIKLEKCRYCNRSFALNRIQIHMKVCEKLANQPKRSVFDSSIQRLKGTDAEPFARNAKPVERPKSNWKKNHEDLIQAIRAARRAHAHLASGGAPSDLPPPPQTIHIDYVQCPYCGRRFNEIAAEKHIKICEKSTHNSIRLPLNEDDKKKYTK